VLSYGNCKSSLPVLLSCRVLAAYVHASIYIWQINDELDQSQLTRHLVQICQFCRIKTETKNRLISLSHNSIICLTSAEGLPWTIKSCAPQYCR